MRDTFLLRLITTDDEKNTLYHMMDKNSGESGYRRAKIILLKDEGYTVPEIRREQPTITISQHQKMDTSIQ